MVLRLLGRGVRLKILGRRQATLLKAQLHDLLLFIYLHLQISFAAPCLDQFGQYYLRSLVDHQHDGRIEHTLNNLRLHARVKPCETIFAYLL